jgi:hypothetical protein
MGLLGISLYAGWAWNNTRTYGPPWNTGMMGQWFGQPQTQASTPITLDEAKAIAQQYLVSLGDPNLAVKEIMEFQYNFYVIFYEKDSGLGAFEMLIWKQAPSSEMMGGNTRMGAGMMGGGIVVGEIVPEPGPNMMWNTKYGVMQGMMGSRRQADISGQMQVSEQDAKSIAESYLSQNFPRSHVEGITHFYGYYTIDFQKDGKIVGMLSVNGYSGEVWYHSWHGAFVQEVELG